MAESYPLGIEELCAFAARSGVKLRRHAERREVALLARVAERDAPIIAAGSEDRRWVIFRLRLPLRVADGAARALALNAAGGPFVWSHDAERAALTVRAAVPIAGVAYTDAGVGAVVLGLREAAEREARALRR
jgi:hypothetical protein